MPYLAALGAFAVGALRRAASIVIFVIGATTGAFLTRYGVLWPVLTAFTLFVLALPTLMHSQDA